MHLRTCWTAGAVACVGLYSAGMAQSVNSIRALEEYLRHGTMLRSTTNPEYSAAIQAIEYIQSAPTEVVPVLSRLAADQELDCGRRMVAVSFLVTTRAPQAESTLVGLLEDPHPLIQTVALGALARAQSQSPVFFKKLKEAALQWERVEIQTGAIMALLELRNRPDASAVVEEVYLSPNTSDLVKLQIARTRTLRKEDFDTSVAKDILYRKLADPEMSLSEQCNITADLVLLGDFSQTYRLVNALEDKRSRDSAVRVLRRVFPEGPGRDSDKVICPKADVDESCVTLWKDYLRVQRGIWATTIPHE